MTSYAIDKLNPLDSKGNYSATSTIQSWYTGRWWVGCYIWYSEEGPRRAPDQPSPLLTVPTASVAITLLLYDGPLLCSFNVAIKGLTGAIASVRLTRQGTPLHQWWNRCYSRGQHRPAIHLYRCINSFIKVMHLWLMKQSTTMTSMNELISYRYASKVNI